MSYYTYVVTSNKDTDFILLDDDDINVDEVETLPEFHYMNQFEDIDYDFIKTLWKKSKQTKKLKYDFQAAVKLTKEIIEDWETFKKGEWFYEYDDEQHQENIELIEEQNRNGLNVYICVR